MSSTTSTSDGPAPILQRKRGRIPKAAAASKQTSYVTTPDELANPSIGDIAAATNILDGVALAISPPPQPTDATTAAIGAPTTVGGVLDGECRRSTRKKIIKFDVRDLLNKHRKPHKIQIEARIDSNAPQTSTKINLPHNTFPSSAAAVVGSGSGGGSVGGGNVVGNSGNTIISAVSTATTSELSIKQKAFMDKSAIFRRLSISEQQNKIINTPPLPPPLAAAALPKLASSLDAAAKIAQARRLSRTQEMFNASLIKSKQNSSLIVAQIESRSSSCGSTNSGSSSGILSQSIAISQPTQKKIGVATTTKRKSVSNTFVTPTIAADAKNATETEITKTPKRRGRQPKNKTVAEQSNITKPNQKQSKSEHADDLVGGELHDEQPQPQPQPQPAARYSKTKSALFGKATTASTARNWKEYKANLAKTNESLESKAQRRLQSEKKLSANRLIEDAILDKTTNSSTTEKEEASSVTAKARPAAVIGSEESHYINVNTTEEEETKQLMATDFIVAAVEEIVTENVVVAEEPQIPKEQQIVATAATSQQNAATSSPISNVNVNKTPLGRKSSSSESESGGSERSNKSYKKGDKLRVSLKRMTLPECGVYNISIASPSGNSNSSHSDAVDGGGSDISSSNSNKININSSSDDSNGGTSNVSSTEATNKSPPTRRSNRLPTKNVAGEKTPLRRQKTKTKPKAIVTFDDKEQKEENIVMELEKSADKALPIDLNATSTGVMDSQTALNMEKCMEKGGEMENNVIKATNFNVSDVGAEIIVTSTTQTAEIGVEAYKTQLEIDSSTPAAIEETATTSYATKKERITLPLKKQVSKFKMYEAAVQNVAANVETSTLLDILNTVKQQNLTISTATKVLPNRDESASAQSVQETLMVVGGEEQKMQEPIIESKIATNSAQCQSYMSSPMQTITNVAYEVEIGFEDENSASAKNLTEAMQILEEAEPNQITAVITPSSPASSVGPSNSDQPDKTLDANTPYFTNVEQPTKMRGKKTPSPTLSVSPTTLETKKPTRRYERRSQRGNASGHKTLEETFAEIAAESSKAVLASKAKQGIEMSDESQGSTTNDSLDSGNSHTKTENTSKRGKTSFKDAIIEKEVAADKNKILEEPATEVAGAGKCVADEVLTKAESNRSKTLILPADADSNSNHSTPSPPRRGRKPKNKKQSPKVSPITVTATQIADNAKASEQVEEESVTKSDTIAEQNWQAASGASAVELATGDTNQVTEYNNQATDEIQISIEQSASISHELSAMNVSIEVESTLYRPTENLDEIKEPTADGSKQSELTRTHHEHLNTTPEKLRKQKRATISRVQGSEVELNEAAKNSTSKQIEQNKTDKHSLAGQPVKSELKSKGNQPNEWKEQCMDETQDVSTNNDRTRELIEAAKGSVTDEAAGQVEAEAPKVTSKHSEFVGIEMKSNKGEAHKGEQAELLEQATPIDEQPKVSKSTTAQQNILESAEKPVELTATAAKDESMTEFKVKVIDSPATEQPRSQSTTPTDKTKKVKKRKDTTKSSPEQKAVAQKPKTEYNEAATAPSPTDTAKSVERKEKRTNEKEDTPGKKSKLCKGKQHTTETSNTNHDAINVAEKESAVELNAGQAAVDAKEAALLAKAPPKKRLLKMQLQLEENSGSSGVEALPTTSTPVKSGTTTSSASESNSSSSSSKTKDSTHKKTKKESKLMEEQQQASFDNPISSTPPLEDESGSGRSANSTPVSKRSKSHKTQDKTPEDKTKSSGGGKRKTKWDQAPVGGGGAGSAEKVDGGKDADNNNKPTTSAKKAEKKKFLTHEEEASQEAAKQMEEKNAKRKRQKKLKEAFEAALTDALSKQQQQQQISIEAAPIGESSGGGITVTRMDIVNKVEQVENLKETVNTETTTPTPKATITTITETLTTIPITTETTAVIAAVKQMPITESTEAEKPTANENIAPMQVVDEEEPDPLKDIEKFIEDGVNLLKRGYKIDDDSVDEVICPKTTLQKDDYKRHQTDVELSATKTKCEEAEEQNATITTDAAANSPTTIREGMITPNESIISEGGVGDELNTTDVKSSFEDSNTELAQNLYYETPADTPIATPTTTPPPKSPTHHHQTQLDSPIEEICGVRRSDRIKLITKTPKALVGRGLVREKERFSIKDDVEMKTHYSLDDHLTDLAQVEAKNAKFLKEMEERLSNFQVIKENEYKCERVVSREARKMLCDCFLTADEEERGELGCGDDCLNRLLMIECGPDCNVKHRCTNKRFQKLLCSPCRVFRTEKKGFGIMADIEILPGEFIMEYVGEVIDGDEFEQRRQAYSLDKNRHYYFMALRSDAIIDATIKGNISRFINHSCDPNAETQKWTVNGELRIGFFSRKSIMPGEEITFDYQYQRYGREAQRCYCESANCRGWIGQEPTSDEGEQIDEDSDAMADVSDEDETDSDSTADKSATLNEDEDGKVKSDGALKEKKRKDGEGGDEDAKAKLKRLSDKSAADKASRRKRKIKEKKAKRMRKAGAETARYLEDPDIEDEVKFLSRGGLRNQSDTLRFSRLVVRAKLPQTRLNLLKILRGGELPCRRLFLDYHGLRLLHGWMSEDGGDMAIRLALLEALESLPIANKTVLTDSKVYQSVRNWCGTALISSNALPAGSGSSPSDESSKESTSSNSMQQEACASASGGGGAPEVPTELQKLALKLTNTWNSLPEIFRIPKRERIEQMKEHEREADRQYAEASALDTNRSYGSGDRYQRDRFGGRGPNSSRYSKPNFGKDNRSITVVGGGGGGGNGGGSGSGAPTDPRRRSAAQDGNNGANNDSMKHLSKEQRREMFAAKVARDEAEKRMAEERREFETKCRFFGLDPKKTRPQDVPFCVDPSTGQWYSVVRQPIPTPPCYAHIQVQPKPKSTDPADYKLPALINSLPRQWKFAITTLGQIYYYHYKQRIPQWHPPTPEQLRAAVEDGDSTDSESCEEAKMINESSEEDDVLIGMDETKLKAYIDKKVEHRRNKRYNRLVDERPISPRKEEDRIYNQIEMRKYKENKEKIRKRKEEIRRKRAESLKTAADNPINDAIVAKFKNGNDSDEPDDAIPIQDYLLSSDEEETMMAECNNSPLLEKIVQGDKIVDELDALTTKRALKRPLPPHRDLSTVSSAGSGSSISGGGGGVAGTVGISSSGGSSEHKRRKSEKKEKSKKSKESDSKYRRNKEKFRCEIAGIIVQHLKPYRKDSCVLGRIQSDEDFNHLARKLTHFVMVKELKYCEAVGQTLVVTESVKNKSREFIKKYMAKYSRTYVRPANDPEFKDIPFKI